MDTITATRYQARLHDTKANRTALARAMHGKDAGQVNSPDPALASTAQLLSECVHEYGVEPIPARVWRGWPREKIHRPRAGRAMLAFWGN